MSILKAIVMGAAVCLAACGDRSSTMEEINSTDITFPDGTKIAAETMRQQIDLQRGLMFRDTLAPGRGMLFVYPSDAVHSHWMYQVKFPVDTIWMDHDQRIVEIVPNMPPCPSKVAHECPQFGGKIPSRFALEVAPGFAAKNSLQVGQRLSF